MESIYIEKQRHFSSQSAVNSSYITSGFDDGSVFFFDTRIGLQIGNFNIHQAPVTAIKYDKSNKFFVTGSLDNSICFVEIEGPSNTKQISNILPSNNKKKEGIRSLAISKQTIVACGYSSSIYVCSFLNPNQNK